MSVLLKP